MLLLMLGLNYLPVLTHLFHGYLPENVRCRYQAVKLRLTGRENI